MMDFKGLLTRFKGPITIVSVVVLIYLLYWIITKYIIIPKNPVTNSVVLLADGIVPSEKNTVDNILKDNILAELNEEEEKKYKNSVELTTFVYIKLMNMDGNYGTKKNIIYKPSSSASQTNDPSFEWFIRPRVNDAVFRIKVADKNRTYYDTVEINDIPIAVWTSLACVVDGNKVNLYKNGKYYKSKVLRGIPQFVNTPILVGKGFTGGFSGIPSYDGYLGGVYYSYKAESESFINNLQGTSLSKSAEKAKDTRPLCDVITEKGQRISTAISKLRGEEEKK